MVCVLVIIYPFTNSHFNFLWISWSNLNPLQSTVQQFKYLRQMVVIQFALKFMHIDVAVMRMKPLERARVCTRYLCISVLKTNKQLTQAHTIQTIIFGKKNPKFQPNKITIFYFCKYCPSSMFCYVLFYVLFYITCALCFHQVTLLNDTLNLYTTTIGSKQVSKPVWIPSHFSGNLITNIHIQIDWAILALHEKWSIWYRFFFVFPYVRFSIEIKIKIFIRQKRCKLQLTWK